MKHASSTSASLGSSDDATVLNGSAVVSHGTDIAPGYAVIAHLHRSRHFDVYDAFSAERACRVIAKVPIPSNEQRLADKRARYIRREGRLLKRLSHPHIVRLYDVVSEPRTALILEMLPGQTLAHLIDTSPRRMVLTDVAQLGLHLCAAIHYLHQHNILHLDLKPSNIIADRGFAKLIDPSIARPPGRGKPGAGTHHYLAPEQARGDLLTPATDVWGIGAVLFEATTDAVPFHAEHAGDEHPDDYEQLLRRAAFVRAHRRVPAAFGVIVDDCLEPDPARRPHVLELMERLHSYLGQP